MRARREVTLSVICALLVACSAAASGPDESRDPTIEGVGVLPSTNTDAVGVTSDSVAAPDSAVATPTTQPVSTIGSLVAGNKLLMIGDSITASAASRYGGEFCKTLVPLGWQVEVDAEPSRFVDFGNTVLDSRLSAKWDAAYVFLGTNYLGDQEAYRKQLEKIVQRLSPSPVVLLTVTLFDDSRQQVNDAITLVGAEFPNVRVVDWGSIAAADAATVFRGDGHHLTNAGRATSGLDGCLCARRCPDPTRQVPEDELHQRLGSERQRQRHAAAEEGRRDGDDGQGANRDDRQGADGDDQAAQHADDGHQPTDTTTTDNAAADDAASHPSAAADYDPASPDHDSTSYGCTAARHVGSLEGPPPRHDARGCRACATDDWVARLCRSASCASAR